MINSNIWWVVSFYFYTVACSSSSDPVSDPGPDPNPPPGSTDCEVLASDLSFPFEGVDGKGVGFALGRILVDNTSIYWYDYDSSQGNTGGGIKSMPKSGGTEKVLASGLGGINGFDIDDTHLYWIEFDIDTGDGFVKKVDKESGEVTVLAQGFPQQPDGTDSPYNIFSPASMALDTDLVCFGEEVGGSALRCVSKNGGAVEDFGRGKGFIPQSMALDNSYFYILDTQSNGLVLRLSRTDAGLDTLTSGFSTTQGLSSLLLDNETLYWVEIKDAGQVFALPATGGAFSVVGENLTNPRVVLTDVSSIYYVAGNGVFKASKNGGTPERAVTCSNIPTSFYIAMDESSLYIVDASTEPNSGKILKSPK